MKVDIFQCSSCSTCHNNKEENYPVEVRWGQGGDLKRFPPRWFERYCYDMTGLLLRYISVVGQTGIGISPGWGEGTGISPGWGESTGISLGWGESTGNSPIRGCKCWNVSWVRRQYRKLSE